MSDDLRIKPDMSSYYGIWLALPQSIDMPDTQGMKESAEICVTYGDEKKLMTLGELVDRIFDRRENS